MRPPSMPWIGLARTVAMEAAPRNIRVNVLEPGPVDKNFQTEIEDHISAAIAINA